VLVQVLVQVLVLVLVPLLVLVQLVPLRCPRHGHLRRQTTPLRTAVHSSRWRVWGVGLACSS
jgi:hypothetical protein